MASDVRQVASERSSHARRLCAALLIGALGAISLPAQAEIKLATWNTLRLGQEPSKDYEAMAAVISMADLVALQEVMDGAAVDHLEAMIEARTGEPWSSMLSHPLGRGRYKEQYGFLWRDSAVAYSEGAAVYLDPGDRFEREPFSAAFVDKQSSQPFVVATAHILYGKSQLDRIPEIQALAGYWEWLQEIYQSHWPIFLVGDFNLPPSHAAWQPLRQTARPLITTGGTTLSSRDGKYASLYDNFLVGAGTAKTVNKAYVLDFPRMLKMTHLRARDTVSDHAPIFVHVDLHKLPGAAAAPFPALTTTGHWEPPQAVSARGNSKSMIYHFPDCPSYNAISKRYRVEFKSGDAAEEAGYRLAGNCQTAVR
ncbi:endonuclease/exonuclease/phosphatase family protein [Pseudomonas aeruginosa]